MQTIRIPSYAPVAFPFRPPPPRIVEPSPALQALKIVGVVVAIGMSVVMSMAGVAAVVLRDVDLNALSTPAAPITTPPVPTAPRTEIFVAHDGDDCAAASLRASHRCEDIGCFTAAGAELRTCLAQPEQGARLCAEMPDPSNAAASAQWIDARCSFEETRDYSDCVRLMSIVSDRCATLDTR